MCKWLENANTLCKQLTLVLVSFLSFVCVSNALALEQKKPSGFLWYNLPKEELKSNHVQLKVPLSKLSYQMRNKVLHYYTMEALHKARSTHKVADMQRFLAIQHYWLNEASAFKHNFMYAMLKNPEYDFTSKNPISALGLRLNHDRDSRNQTNTISSLTHNYGMLFFYKGADSYSQKQASVLMDFATRYHFSFIPVSTDGVLLGEFPGSRKDTGQAKRLGIKMTPSIVLVHPKTNKVYPVANGFVTQDFLTEQLMIVAKQIRREQQGEEVLYD